jgi:hypothetical protein
MASIAFHHGHQSLSEKYATLEGILATKALGKTRR